MEDDVLLGSTRRALAYRLATTQARGRTPSTVAGVVRGGTLVRLWLPGAGGEDAQSSGGEVPAR